MTEKQTERVKTKIQKYKKTLAADKKHWGGYYHDGQGIRYLIPAQFIKIGDYKGGLRYLNWFDKNFPDDCGYPIFLFEWTFILFMSGKLIEAEQKAQSTFFSNTYLFDHFLGKEPLNLEKYENSNWEDASLIEHFTYSMEVPAFTEFVHWIESILVTKSFLDKANEFVEINRMLKTEPVGTRRTELVQRLSILQYGEFDY